MDYIKLIQKWSGWLIAGAVVAFLGYGIGAHVSMEPEAWQTFFGAKLAQLFIAVVAIGTILFFDWVYPRHTVKELLDINPLSTWQEKLVAAVFLLGVGFITMFAMKGGAF